MMTLFYADSTIIKDKLFFMFISFEKLDFVEVKIYFGKSISNIFEDDFAEIKIR